MRPSLDRNRGPGQEDVIRQALLASSLKLLWAIRAVIVAAGLAALMATIASWLMTHLTGTRSDWAGPLQVYAIGIAALLLAGAFGYSRLVPRAEIAPATAGREPAFAAIVPLFLLVLAALTVLQAPAIAAWWTTDRALLQEAMGTGRDPMDLRIIPTVILLSLPALAGIALAACVLTSLAGSAERADRRFRLLAACALLLTALVAGGRLILHGGGALGGTVRSLVEQSADQEAIAQVSGWLARHDAPAADVSRRLIWLLCGYAVVAAVAGLISSGRTSSYRSTSAE